MRCVDLCLCYNGTRHNGTRHNHKLARPIERVTHTCIHSSYIFGCSIYHRWCSADMVTSVPFAMQSIYVMPNAPEPNLFPTPNCNLHFPIRPYSSIAHAFGINSAHYSTSSYQKRRKTKQNQNEHNLVPLTFHMNAWSPNNIVAQPLQLQYCVPRFSSAHTHTHKRTVASRLPIYRRQLQFRQHQCNLAVFEESLSRTVVAISNWKFVVVDVDQCKHNSQQQHQQSQLQLTLTCEMENGRKFRTQFIFSYTIWCT